MKRILLVALAAVAVVGCKKTDMTSAGSDTGVVQFKASTSSLTRTTTDGLESSWVMGDQIGIYMEGDNSAYNVAYEAASSGSETTFSLVTGETALEYPNSGTVDFYAYYPYQSYLTEGITSGDADYYISRDIYVADVTDQSDLGAIDFMVASATDRSADNEPTDGISLNFEHMLSKVELTINAMETLDDLSDLVVSISGVADKVKYSYNGDYINVISYGDGVEFNIVEQTTNSETGKVTQVVAAAILNPEVIPSPVFTFTLGTMSYSVDITEVLQESDAEGFESVAPDGDLSFETLQGMMHTFTLYLGENMVKFTDSDIEKWEDGNTTTSTDYAERIGDGSESNPFYVYDAADMAMIGTSDEEYVKDGIGNKGGVWSLDAHYKMMNNIDLGCDEDNVWAPIGTLSNAFTGSLDGDSKVISGLVTGGSNEYEGLFGYIGSDGKLSNLGVIDCNVSGTNFIGGIVGWNAGIIENCYVSGVVSTTNGYIGGVVGRSVGTVHKCYNLAAVIGVDIVGGVVGSLESNSAVINCYNIGDVEGSGSTIGGIVGNNYSGSIIGCYNSGNISGYDQVGGISGSADSESIVKGCFNSGDIVATGEAVGAISGYNGGVFEYNYYLTESVDDGVYGISSYTDNNEYAQAISYDEMIAHGEVVMQKLNNSIVDYNTTATDGYEATSAWTYNISKSIYPTLDFTTTEVHDITDFGDGTSDESPIQLYFVTDFSPRGATTSNSNIDGSLHYKMMADIDLEGDANNQWTMIGELTGSFDGGGHKLSGVYVYINQGNDYVAPVVKNYGTIKDLTIDGAIISSSFGGEAAGLVYENYGNVNGCGNEGTAISYGMDVAGLVYANKSGATIINSYNTGELYGTFEYGVVCTNSGTIANSYSIGVELYSSGGTVKNCYHQVDGSYTYYETESSRSTPSDSSTLLDFLNPAAVTYNKTATEGLEAWSWTLSGDYPTLMFETVAVSDND